MLIANQIWQCIDLDILDSAEFLAEQLVANEDAPDTRFLLGYVQARRGQYASAILTCQDHLNHVDCLWVYAHSCLKLDRVSEGLNALDKYKTQWFITDNDNPLPSPLGRSQFCPSVFFLLYGNLRSKIDEEASLEFYTLSARLNPFLFENVSHLAKSTRVSLVPENLFTNFTNPFAYTSDLNEISLTAPAALSGLGAASPVADETVPPRVGIAKTATSTPRRFETPHRVLSTPLNALQSGPAVQSPGFNTSVGVSNIVPTLGNSLGNVNGQGIFQTPSNLKLKKNPHQTQAVPHMQSVPQALTVPHTQFTNHQQNYSGAAHPGHNRRRERIHSLSIMLSDQSSLSSLGKNVFAQLDPLNEDNSQFEDVRERGVSALTTIAEILNSMSCGEFKPALQQFERLSEPIKQSPTLLALKGRILLETGNYDKCVENYEVLRQLQPDRCRDMEYMSTALWHAKRDADLAMLAYELNRPESPSRREWQSWCVMGNSFSLRNDSNNAIKCFQRATHINPDSAYAHTLMGYEYCTAEELETGEACFTRALSKDPNLYNAWYGLGTVSYNMGEFDKAERLFLEAINLNPCNPVLLCYLGTVYEAKGDLHRAMACFDEAAKESPDSPIPRFRRAEALINAERFKDALDELLALESIAPEDSSVHLAIARAYQGLGHTDMAVQQLTIAQNLAPKSAQSLRKILEAM